MSTKLFKFYNLIVLISVFGLFSLFAPKNVSAQVVVASGSDTVTHNSERTATWSAAPLISGHTYTFHVTNNSMNGFFLSVCNGTCLGTNDFTNNSGLTNVNGNFGLPYTSQNLQSNPNFEIYFTDTNAATSMGAFLRCNQSSTDCSWTWVLSDNASSSSPTPTPTSAPTLTPTPTSTTASTTAPTTTPATTSTPSTTTSSSPTSAPTPTSSPLKSTTTPVPKITPVGVLGKTTPFPTTNSIASSSAATVAAVPIISTPVNPLYIVLVSLAVVGGIVIIILANLPRIKSPSKFIPPTTITSSTPPTTIITSTAVVPPTSSVNLPPPASPIIPPTLPTDPPSLKV